MQLHKEVTQRSNLNSNYLSVTFVSNFLTILFAFFVFNRLTSKVRFEMRYDARADALRASSIMNNYFHHSQAQWLLNLTLVLFSLVSTLLEGVPFSRLGERPDKKYKEIQRL